MNREAGLLSWFKGRRRFKKNVDSEAAALRKLDPRKRISIIGPGIMPIPPVGWGAVESLIWDYRCALLRLGHEVQVVNNPSPRKIIKEVNAFRPDFVHIQYDDHWHLASRIECRLQAITSHYGYLEQIHRHDKGYRKIHQGIVDGRFYIFCLSEGIKTTYVNCGVPKSRLLVTVNGARGDLFNFNEQAELDQTICLGKITDRKRQFLFQQIPKVDFVGNKDDRRFNYSAANYLGEWSKNTLYKNLTRYTNLMLLSDGEAHPLVCCEALMAGLGLVVSEMATGNLDLQQPFIDVIPESKIRDLGYVSQILEENRRKSRSMRQQIRAYALENFDWEKLVKKYEQLVLQLSKL